MLKKCKILAINEGTFIIPTFFAAVWLLLPHHAHKLNGNKIVFVL